MRISLVLVLLTACRGASTGNATTAGSATHSAVSATPTTGPASPAPCVDTACLADRCEHGDIASCGAAARRLAASPSRSDRQRAVHLHELGCAGDNAACDALADDLEAGAFTDKDMVRAAALRTTLCDRQVGNACWNLSRQFEAGDGVHTDQERADQLKERACEVGSAETCERLATNDRPDLFQRAFDLYLARCHAGELAACSQAHGLVIFHHVATDVPHTDWAAVLATQNAACAGGDAEACAALSRLHSGGGFPRDLATGKAEDFATRGCELGSAQACSFLASLRGRRYGADVSALVLRACQLGDRESCWAPGKQIANAPVLSRAVLIRGCELGLSVCCLHGVEMLDKGVGGPVDHPGARRLQDLQCGEGDEQACVALAEAARQRGDLVAERGFQLRLCRAEQRSGGCEIYARRLRAACDGHDAASCQELERFLAALTPARRDLAGFACCRDQRGIAASPAGQLAAFVDALARHDAKAVRAFVHPGRGMKVRTWWDGRFDAVDRTRRIRARSLRLELLAHVTPSELDKLDCPDAFDNDAATCRSWDPDLGATYQLLRDRGRVYVLAIDARTEAVAVP
jgi:TPR repeat protein